MKRMFIDVETTGLDERTASTVELAGVVDIDGQVVDEFTWYIKPYGTEVSKKSLKTIGLTEQDLHDRGESVEVVVGKFKALLDTHIDRYNKADKFFFYAYNSPFDYRFTRALWEGPGRQEYFGSYFWFPDMCIMRMVQEELRGERSRIKNFKLLTVAEYLGIELNPQRLHAGRYDIDIAREVYYRLCGRKEVEVA